MQKLQKGQICLARGNYYTLGGPIEVKFDEKSSCPKNIGKIPFPRFSRTIISPLVNDDETKFSQIQEIIEQSKGRSTLETS